MMMRSSSSESEHISACARARSHSQSREIPGRIGPPIPGAEISAPPPGNFRPSGRNFRPPSSSIAGGGLVVAACPLPDRERGAESWPTPSPVGAESSGSRRDGNGLAGKQPCGQAVPSSAVIESGAESRGSSIPASLETEFQRRRARGGNVPLDRQLLFPHSADSNLENLAHQGARRGVRPWGRTPRLAPASILQRVLDGTCRTTSHGHPAK